MGCRGASIAAIRKGQYLRKNNPALLPD